MSNMELKVKMDRLVLHSGYEKNEQIYCSVVKIMKMRYKDVPLHQINKIAKEVLLC